MEAKFSTQLRSTLTHHMDGRRKNYGYIENQKTDRGLGD